MRLQRPVQQELVGAEAERAGQAHQSEAAGQEERS
jgi:hypothetical protein